MSLFQAGVLGLIQGITEWLPVSSSGHLVIYQQKILKLSPPIFFDVLLHFASLCVILSIFRRKIAEILRSVLKKDKDPENFEYARNIIIASIPIAACGLLFENFIKDLFLNIKAVSVSLIVTGLFLSLSRFAGKSKNTVTIRSSLLVGIAQAIALVPGISRSGITISTGILAGIRKEKAAEFSFILAVPAILGATIFEISRIEQIQGSFFMPLFAGMVVSFISGYFSLRLLLNLVKKGKLYWFSIYCLILGFTLLMQR